MHDKDKLVKEQRLNEATVKNYTGLEGKFGIILKHLGLPIIGESVSGYSSSEFPDVYELPDENDELPVADLDPFLSQIGMIFEGTKYGSNLEIKYLKYGDVLDPESTPLSPVYKEAEKILIVTYNGIIVYREVEHDLEYFVPMKEWENAIEKFYSWAKKKAEEFYKKEQAAENVEKKKDKLNLLELLRRKWGI